MPLEDYLLPNENIMYQSEFKVKYGGNSYKLLLTDIRLVLYARRGVMFKRDSVVTEAIRNVEGIKFKSTGLVRKKAYLEVTSKSKIFLTGKPEAMKTLYQRLLPFLEPEMRQCPAANSSAQPTIVPSSSIGQVAAKPPTFCPNCGIELSPNMKFCYNCGKQTS